MPQMIEFTIIACFELLLTGVTSGALAIVSKMTAIHAVLKVGNRLTPPGNVVGLANASAPCPPTRPDRQGEFRAVSRAR